MVLQPLVWAVLFLGSKTELVEYILRNTEVTKKYQCNLSPLLRYLPNRCMWHPNSIQFYPSHSRWQWCRPWFASLDRITEIVFQSSLRMHPAWSSMGYDSKRLHASWFFITFKDLKVIDLAWPRIDLDNATCTFFLKLIEFCTHNFNFDVSCMGACNHTITGTP